MIFYRYWHLSSRKEHIASCCHYFNKRSHFMVYTEKYDDTDDIIGKEKMGFNK